MRDDDKRFLQHMLMELADATGHEYHVETWSPGDGRTRYRLTLKLDNGEATIPHAHYLSLAELRAFTGGILCALRQVGNHGDSRAA